MINAPNEIWAFYTPEDFDDDATVTAYETPQYGSVKYVRADCIDALKSTQPTPKVKPLEFYRPYERTTGYMIAETCLPNLYYETDLRADGKAYYCKVRATHSVYGLSDMYQSESAAQAAAQSDYTRRILAAIGVE